ncbi:uncharacterized protein EV420DRAFT_1181155 [Desarmillaria tabescens]|uniref:MYND-type domain-containing protein n=1 Tax=Armillaria tabescens TaxID=1929756 RepID=A0AA39NB01_ARMTA|nr:uncharacterized protein EV420DRAFT_1181155 [Desarmillaria tabescens]KAK0462305.1 hypothetical protein EV420DRAFT_1181155 [Desarmillaria tabescens]
MSQVNGALGRTFCEKYNLLFFPGNGSASTFVMAEKSEELADHLSRGRPSNIHRPTTYPCTVVNPGNSQKVKIQPLIGTSDDGVYLNPADIHKLGLGDTGQTVATRHGPCKVYSGVSFFFENDHNGGTIRYHVPHILCLEGDTAYSDATFNTKKEGIIGLPRIDNHLIFIHLMHVHVIDLSIVPSFQQYLTHMIPLTAIKFDRNVRAHLPPPGTCIADFSAVYDAARKHRAPPYRVLLQDMSVPLLRYRDECRTCRKRENPQDGIKLRICSRCTKEGRKARALYCGEACQRADWKKHKAEHAGTQPWDIQNTYPDMVVVPPPEERHQ